MLLKILEFTKAKKRAYFYGKSRQMANRNVPLQT